MKPAEFDTHLQELNVQRARHEKVIETANRRIKAGVKLTAAAYGTVAKATMDLADVLDVIIRSDEHYRKNPWTRFYFVPDGHVHSSMACSTCRRTTPFIWLTADSGRTVTEMIGEYGMTMCTVCFPSAPTDPRFETLGARGEAAKAEKDAAAKAKADLKAAKDAATPRDDDGNPLKIGWDTPKTERGARNLLASRLYDVHLYRQLGTMDDSGAHPEDTQWMKDANTLSRSIARLCGGNAIQIFTDAFEKAQKKAAADLRKAEKNRK